MSSFPNDSAIKVTPGSSLEKEIASASSVSEIQQILHRAAQEQHLVEPDPFDSEGKNYFAFRPVQPGTLAAAKGFAKTLVIDGTKHIVEGATEAELASNELALMRQLFAAPAATTQEEQPRNERGQFITHDPSAVALAPTVVSALEAAGISADALRNYSDQQKANAYEQSWAEATETFRANHPDWMGGLDNQNLFAKLLSENNLVDAEDKAAALEAVYSYAVENKMLVEPAEKTLERKINEARTVEEIQAAIGYRSMNGRDSGMWGR